MPLTENELRTYAMNYKKSGNVSVFEEDCDVLEYLLDNCEITVPEENRFFVSVNAGDIMFNKSCGRGNKFSHIVSDNGLQAGFDKLIYTGYYDLSHTSADWQSVTELGIFGLRERVKEYAPKYGDNAKKQSFYSNTLRVYDAALRFIARAAKAAQSAGKPEMAAGLEALAVRKPETLFEVMQTTIIYYVLQHMFEGDLLRTLGRLDSLYYPYYIKEDKARANELIMDFLREIDRLKAPSNIPFAIGGTDVNGNSLVNELSFALVEAYNKAGTTNTKFHILCSENMPKDIVVRALDGVRKGNNSIVFMNDKKIIESLVKIGADKADAADYHVVGCYECGARQEITCSCGTRINIPKALECALNNGRDMLTGELIGLENSGKWKSFDDLYDEFIRQMVYFCRSAMKLTDLWEAHYSEIHSAPIFSATYETALIKGGDIYGDHAAKYNNSSLNAIGLATAVDSLAAIRKAVFEDKLITADELPEILRTNWKNKEPLRLLIKNKYPKFGQDDTRTDALARDLVKRLADTVDGKPNNKGGVYRLGLFSIDWRWEMGRYTAASFDGRLSGETLSQNASATFGAVKNGATAHLKSVAAIDASYTPNGTIADIDLHFSAVSGDNGLKALVSSLKTFFELGGFGVQYNVLNTEVLKRAKLHPEEYPDLQVRLCGWNVLFSSLSEKEKQEFIERSAQ